MAEDRPWLERVVELFGEDVVQTGNVHRGHPVVELFWPGWVDDDPEASELGFYDVLSPKYYEDGVPADDEERPCPGCGLTAESSDGPDPCLGMIDGVRFACCGHGRPGSGVGGAYVSLEDGRILRGRDARRFFARKGVGPALGGSC